MRLNLRLRWLAMAWHAFSEKYAPRCARPECRDDGIWQRLRRKKRRVLIQGSWHCLEECLERAINDALQPVRSPSAYRSSPHRIPLGLLLLSRQQVTPAQVRAALEAQREAGCGLVGEWLQTLGFVSEQQVTAALARQWSCPVLHTGSTAPASTSAFAVPFPLLESSFMIPIAYVEPSRTLHIAFGERIDYSVLYAIEQMLGCHTDPCIAAPSWLRTRLEWLSMQRRPGEVVFDGLNEVSEFTRIVRSYSTCVTASELSIAACNSHLWVRMGGASGRQFDLLLRLPAGPVDTLPLAPAAAAV